MNAFDGGALRRGVGRKTRFEGYLLKKCWGPVGRVQVHLSRSLNPIGHVSRKTMEILIHYKLF